MKYFTYKNFLLNKQALKPNPYRDTLSDPVLTQLNALEKFCEAKEKAKYREIYNVSSGRFPTNWKNDLKDVMSISHISEKKMGVIAGTAFTNRTRHNGRTNMDNFLDDFVDLVARELPISMSSVTYSGLSQEMQDLLKKIYNTMRTRSDPKRKYPIKITQEGIKGNTITPLLGLILEAVQGISDTEKKSTFASARSASSYKMSLVADFEVPDIGLEETKRGITSKDIIETSSFHIGSFSVGKIIQPKGNWPELMDALAAVVANILDYTTKNPNERISTIRKKLISEISYLITNYLVIRMTEFLPTSDGIFYFASNRGVLLGSEFVAGIRDFHKLNILGKAVLIDDASATELRRLRLSELLATYQQLQMRYNFDTSGTAGLYEEYIHTKTKMGSYLKSGNFDLWYGTK